MNENELRIVEMVRETLEGIHPKGWQLVWIDYCDELNDQQLKALANGDYEDVMMQVWDSISESQHMAAYDFANAALGKVILDLEEAGDDEGVELLGEMWLDLRQELVDDLVESDETDYIAKLARNSGMVKVMVPLIDEDAADWGEDRTAQQIVDALGGGSLDTAQGLIDEVPTDLGMAYIVAAVPATVLAERCGERLELTIENPNVIYGNPFTGGVWDATFKGVTVKTNNYMADGAWGYTVDDVFGGYCCTSEVTTA